jgi:hypothetical protein
MKPFYARSTECVAAGKTKTTNDKRAQIERAQYEKIVSDVGGGRGSVCERG